MNLALGASGLGLAALVLSSCGYNRTPNFAVEAPFFKVPGDFRQKIIAWTKRYYVEPQSVRLLGVTDPTPALTGISGVPVWFVCAELDVRQRGGPYMGPRRIAFGFHPEFSAPMERRQIDLRNEDCDKPSSPGVNGQMRCVARGRLVELDYSAERPNDERLRADSVESVVVAKHTVRRRSLEEGEVLAQQWSTGSSLSKALP